MTCCWVVVGRGGEGVRRYWEHVVSGEHNTEGAEATAVSCAEVSEVSGVTKHYSW